MPYAPDKLMWVKGGESPNPLGRKLARQTIQGAIERFLKKNLTQKKLQTLYDTLPAKDKLSLAMMLVPYVLPKKADEAVSRDEIEQVRTLLETKLVKNG